LRRLLSSRLRVGLLALLLAGLSVPVSAAGLEPREDHDRFSGADPVREAGEARWEADRARWLRLRRSAAARADRLRSRGEFADLTGREVVDLAQDEFAKALDGDLGGGQDLPEGVKVAEHLSDFTARLETTEGEPAGVMISESPLSRSTAGSAPEAIDLNLRADAEGGGYAPENAGTDMSLPDEADEPVVWKELGIELRLGGAGDASAMLRDDRLFFADAVGRDADYALVPVEGGVEVTWQIRADDAPEQYRMQFTMPAEAHLEAVREPGGVAFLSARVVGGDGEILQEISAPVAEDADGTPVAALATVEGDTMVVTVRHRGLDVRYPLYVDPEVQEYWRVGGGFNTCGSGSWGGSWAPGTDQAPGDSNWAFSCWGLGGHGLYVGNISGCGWYTQGRRGWWDWIPRPGSYVRAVEWQGSRHTPAYNYTDLTRFYAGLWDPHHGFVAFNEWGHAAHWTFPQQAAHNTEGTVATFGLKTQHSSGVYCGGNAGMDGVRLIVVDRNPPTDVRPTSFRLSDGTGLTWPAGAPRRETAWHNPGSDNVLSGGEINFRAGVYANDRGFGLQGFDIVDAATEATQIWGYGMGCVGNRNAPWPCPTGFGTPETDGSAWRFPDGVTEAVVRAHDVAGSIGRGERINIKIDRTGPLIDPYGDLWNLRNQTLTNPRVWMQARAWDDPPGGQSSTLPRSGVNTLTVKVDGVIKATFGPGDRSCDSYSCSIDRGFTLATDTAGDFGGEHRIRIEATDAVGNAAAPFEFSVWYYPTSIAFGGDNRNIDTLSERTGVIAAVDGHDDPFFHWRGLHPDDVAGICAPGVAEDGVLAQCIDENALQTNVEATAIDDVGVELVDEDPFASASTSGTRYRINATGGTWATVRNSANNLVMGYARDGDHIMAVDKRLGYYGGSVTGPNGNWNHGCGWVKAQNAPTKVGPGSSPCAAGFRVRSPTFARRFNCNGCGQASQNLYRPLRDTKLCANLSSLFNRNEKTCVREITTLTPDNLVGWRYFTRGATQDTGWIMVSVKHRSNAAGQWGFVRAADLPTLYKDS
jgi:hypothetical protein